MIAEPTRSLLEEIVRRQARSLLQYVSEAFPWTSPEEQDALQRLHQIIGEEYRAVGDLVRFLVRNHRTPPLMGSYPMNFTNINYVTLDHLLRLLVDYEKTAVQELKQALSRLADGEARNLVQAMLDMKRRHLETLQALAARSRQPVST
jgi:rubrerythrin